MKKLLSSLTLVGVLFLGACGDSQAPSPLPASPPDDAGEVIDKVWNPYPWGNYFYLKIKGVVNHNQVIFWWRVQDYEFFRCGIGERWDYDVFGMCSPDIDFEDQP